MDQTVSLPDKITPSFFLFGDCAESADLELAAIHFCEQDGLTLPAHYGIIEE